MPQGHFGAPQPGQGTAFKEQLLGSNTPPEASIQPTFPPPAVTADSPQPSEASQRRPAYLLHRDLVIGKGSYGQVCIASRGEPEGHSNGRSGKRKKFACKCVMLRNDPKYIAKLQEEVNVLRELRGHDNVIRLYDVFCVDNELFIITELGRGGDLFHLLTTHPKHGVTEAYAGTLFNDSAGRPRCSSLCFYVVHWPFLFCSTIRDLAKTVSEMLSAVAFLHSRSICHRDLKLENWVLESGKDVWSPLKLIDFGLSTHFSPGQRLSRVVGSSYYVAPEVLKKSYTEACDLWSLGVIVYMLLSGAPPFYGKNDEAIKSSIVQGEYTFPHELFRDVSDEAMAFVSTLLSYNIEYRYTAEQALTHPWLTNNCDPEGLIKSKDSARGIGVQIEDGRAEPMQL
jgi:serine/threonine protein kinase